MMILLIYNIFLWKTFYKTQFKKNVMKIFKKIKEIFDKPKNDDDVILGDD